MFNMLMLPLRSQLINVLKKIVNTCIEKLAHI